MVQGRGKTAVKKIEVIFVYEVVYLYVEYIHTLQVHTYWRESRQSIRKRGCSYYIISHIYFMNWQMEP